MGGQRLHNGLLDVATAMRANADLVEFKNQKPRDRFQSRGCIWCRLPESNWPPDDYKSTALPNELSRRKLEGRILYYLMRVRVGFPPFFGGSLSSGGFFVPSLSVAAGLTGTDERNGVTDASSGAVSARNSTASLADS